ncbi:MAG: hypothetical protein L6V35_03675 [Alistipes putredinis]|nr:MAG: hypothetical protein L6V35_03675 [Alistipes putredinis]
MITFFHARYGVYADDRTVEHAPHCGTSLACYVHALVVDFNAFLRWVRMFPEVVGNHSFAQGHRKQTLVLVELSCKDDVGFPLRRGFGLFAGCGDDFVYFGLCIPALLLLLDYLIADFLFVVLQGFERAFCSVPRRR